MKRSTVLLLERDEGVIGRLTRRLNVEGVRVLPRQTLREALDAAPSVEAIILGHLPPVESEPQRIGHELQASGCQAALFFHPREGSEALAVQALRLRARDYITQPDHESLAATVLRYLDDRGILSEHGERIVGDSSQIKELRRSLQNVAASNCNLLIHGETGTGKELAATTVHEWSSRSRRPFVAVNCAALPDTLLESELFGFERGAFTGAYSSSKGKIALADKGTLFLDEIGDLCAQGQAKLLRVLESRKLDRLGGSSPVAVDIRVIAATNRPLEEMVQKGAFRGDLYYRLNVAQITLPPLRERADDIPALANYFIREINRQPLRQIEGICPEVVHLLLRYSWPGNIRELRNVLEAAAVQRSRGSIGRADLPGWFLHRVSSRTSSKDERAEVLFALEQTGWNKSEAAARLQCSRMTLYRKMAKFHIEGGANRHAS